jgi:oligopeptide/dipeptide ABC transporter ATP-binding protein
VATAQDLPPGCSFAERCPRARPICREQAPALRQVGPEHRAACHFAEEVMAAPAVAAAAEARS